MGSSSTPIRRILMRMIFISSGAVLAVTTTAFCAYEFLTFRQSSVQQLQTLSQAIASNSTAALAFDNADDAAVVLSAFRADPHIVGRALDFDGGQKTVVGILPASFDFSTIFTPGSRVDIFECFPLTPETNKGGNTLAIVGRLKPGVSVQQAQAEATVLAKLQVEAHKERNSFDPKVSMLTKHVSGRLRLILWRGIGKAEIVPDVDEASVRAVLAAP